MATLRQRSTSDLALQKATGPVKSNHQIDSESQAFLPNQSENRLQPNCEGLDKFAMQYFDEEATRGYLQMLHGLIERLTEKSKNSVNRHHVFFFVTDQPARRTPAASLSFAPSLLRISISLVSLFSLVP